MALKWKINASDVYDFMGMIVTSGSNDLFAPRERKPGYSYDWPDENGIQYDLSQVNFKARTVKLAFWILADSEFNFRQNYQKVKHLLESPGYFTIYNEEVREKMNVFCSTINKFERKTPLLQEENPDRKQYAAYMEVTLNEVTDVPDVITMKAIQQIDRVGDYFIDAGVGSPDIDPACFSSSGLPITYRSSNNSVATIVNGKIKIIKVGSATITATQPGNEFFYPANPLDIALRVF